MSYRLERERTATTPYIFIDEAKGYMRFSGESYLENVPDFFREINEWLERYLASDFAELTFDCAMEYFNSSTTKLLHNMIRSMDKRAADGKKIVVNWISLDGDTMIIECGEDFQEDFQNVKINLIVQE